MSEPRITVPHCAGATHGSNGKVSVVILHDEEYPLSDTSAEKIAAYFARACPPRRSGCAHYVIDSNSEQHVVPDNQRALHAPPNAGAIGIERDGYASWKVEDWNQPLAQLTTCRVAARTAELLVRHDLPVQWVTAEAMKAGARGVSDHRTRSAAYGQSSHWDPGPAFPREAFMALVLTATAWLRQTAVFQEANGLTVDGDAGPATLAKVTELLYGGGAGGEARPAPAATVPASRSFTDEPATGVLSQWMKGPRVRALQAALGVPADGYFGIATGAAVRQFQASHGLVADGLVGPATMNALTPVVAPPPAGERLAVDGDFGPATTKRLQGALGVTPDGDFGPASKRALQALLGVRVDGVVGPMTVRALQRLVGAPQDGQWGPETTRHLQLWLNAR